MYPRLSDFIYDVFGIYVPIPIQSYGFFVALAFLIAGYLLHLELKRKHKEGLLKSVTRKVLVGKKFQIKDLILPAIIGFVIGFKLLGIILNYSVFYDDPQHYVLSTEGHFFGGLIGAALSAYLTYRDKKKQELDKPRWEEIKIDPHQLTPNIVVIGIIASVIGAKIFHNLENFDEFLKDPIDALFSFSGLTFYGGLIVATITLLWYGKKNGISPKILADAAAPAIMLGYGIGRIGCHVSGDGDWGIINSAYISTVDGGVMLASAEQFAAEVQNHAAYLIHQFGSLEAVRHTATPAFWGLPDWLFAYAYPHNVLNQGVPLAGCSGSYCNYLPLPVYPTPIYETTICTIFFGILWAIRKRINIYGMLFSIYLVLNGVERFFIEKIRVNEVYQIFGAQITQAEIISSLLIIIGLTGIVYLKFFAKQKAG